MENNNIYAKMNVVRTELSKYLKKGGKNNYSNYSYFQLDDFMPTLLQLCNDNGLFTQFWIGRDEVEMPSEIVEVTTTDAEGRPAITKTIKENFSYMEFAHLLVIDVETKEEIEFTKETANCSLSGAQPIQNLGSKTTYMKRYMYMDAFEIVENDKIEEETGKPAPKVEKKTTKSSKPKVEAVATQPVYTEAPTVEAMYEANNMVEPTIAYSTGSSLAASPTPISMEVTQPTNVSPVVEASVDVQTEALMSMETKMELANMFKEAGFDPRTTIAEFTQALGVQDVPFLKESDKERIIELFNKKRR
jgi:hypothetical protein